MNKTITIMKIIRRILKNTMKIPIITTTLIAKKIILEISFF